MTELLAAQRAPQLLERDRQLGALSALLDVVRQDRSGRLVLLGGEAGVGKTSLVRRFCEEQSRSSPVLWGACDSLFTPRPLGPMVDIAALTGGELERLVEEAKPHQVATAFLQELAAGAPAIVVVEDLHWADEATLDVVGIVGRRIATVPALVVATYRDELEPGHPLRLLLGDLATVTHVERTRLPALSADAVAELAGPHGVDPAELYRVTGGNPFFVTEALAAGQETLLPPTIRDAVLARAGRLSPPARELLEAVAVAPPQAELWLLEAVAGESLACLEECLASGMIDSHGSAVAFRHELARLAVEESVAPNRRTSLHKLTVAALAEPPAGHPDLARLAHHAEAAGDAEAVLRFAPAAAERAASLGAHREAAAQYARALRFGDHLPLERQAELLERRSYECYVTDQSVEAIAALERAVELYRGLGDGPREGAALSALARRVWCGGGIADAGEIARRAVSLLERFPPSRELALAYSSLSSVAMNEEDAAATLAWGTRAIDLAQRFDDVESLVYVLNTTGTAEALGGASQGFEKLERSLAWAEEAGLEDHVGRAFIHLAWTIMRTRRYDLLGRVEAGIEWCDEHGLDLWRLYLLAYRARMDLDRGRWDEAADAASFVLTHRRTAVLLKVLALTVLGLARARRGDPDHRRLLDEALELTEVAGELQHLGPVAVARGEVAWLEGDFDAVARETQACLELAQRREAPWVIGELAFWRRQAGLREDLPGEAAEPYAAQLRGEWQRAADLWVQIGCPYEAALALADGDDAQAARRGLDELQALGARPAAAIVARRLRERGASGLPRGPRPSTRKNPANLTTREIEVLALVSQGLRNAKIAERLFVSEKTVDHHVSAILRKLAVKTRVQASAEAARLGIELEPS